jgi:hypothetical protein
MPSYEVTSPDGKKWVVDAPEGATQEQVLSYAKSQWSAKPQEPQAPQASVQVGRTLSRDLPRQAGLTVRAGVQGLASLPGLVNDSIGGLYNTAANAIQGQGKGFRFQPTAFALGNVMDAAGVAKPETADERVVQDATTLGFGAMSGSGAAQAIGQRLPQAATAAREVLGKLAANPLAQVTSGVGAGLAGGSTREAGGSGGAQFLASLAGGLTAPLAVGKGVDWISSISSRLKEAKNPEQLTATLRMELGRAGIQWDDLSANVKVQLQNDAKKAVYSGQPLDTAALRRLADYRATGATPLLGDITQDPLILTRQRNYSKALANMENPGADSLPLLENRNAASVIDSINRLGNSADDAFAAGQRLVGGVQARDAALQTQETANYAAARAAYGRDIPLDRGAFLQAANRGLDDSNTGYALPSIVRNILNEFSDNPNQPFTVDRIDSLKRVLSNEAFKAQRSGDGNAGMAIKAVRQALDDVQPRLPSAGGSQLVTSQQAATMQQGDQAAEALRLFDSARGFARSRRQWQESARFIEDALNGAEPDKFVQKHIIGGSVEELGRIRQSFGNDKQVMDSIKQQMIDYIKQSGGVEDGFTKFSSAGMQKALDRLGDRKLSMFFDNQEIQQIKSAISVGRSMQVQPAGSAVNNSNTAGTALGQLVNLGRNVPIIGPNISQPLNAMAMRFELGRMQNLTPGLLGQPQRPLPLPNVVTGGLLAAPMLQPSE